MCLSSDKLLWREEREFPVNYDHRLAVGTMQGVTCLVSFQNLILIPIYIQGKLYFDPVVLHLNYSQ